MLCISCVLIAVFSGEVRTVPLSRPCTVVVSRVIRAACYLAELVLSRRAMLCDRVRLVSVLVILVRTCLLLRFGVRFMLTVPLVVATLRSRCITWLAWLMFCVTRRSVWPCAVVLGVRSVTRVRAPRLVSGAPNLRVVKVAKSCLCLCRFLMWRNSLPSVLTTGCSLVGV